MIYKKHYLVDKPKATIIIVHGIAEHSGRYEYLAKKLNEENYDVLTYDQLGHGRSKGSRGKIKSFHNHIDVLHELVQEEKKRTSNKVFLLGHSMGGGVVNIYAVKYGDIDGIVSVAAATQTPKNARALKYTGFWYLRWIRLSTSMFDNDLAKDPSVLEKSKKDPLMLSHMYVSLIGEQFIKGVKYLHKNIDKFVVPILYVHGTDDKIVDISASKDMMAKIPSTDKEFIICEGEYHELLNDYNKYKYITNIIEWLNKRA